MAGFAARTNTAVGAHDPLTARALVVNDTALVTVDVIGIDAQLSQRVRSRCSLPTHAVIILATHTHGGPASMPGRLWAQADTTFMDQLENSIIQAIEQAISAQQEAHLVGGTAADPGHAKNRRQPDGPVDHCLPILRFDNARGEPIAILTSYACHPVVLGADNLAWTSDYPHFVREHLELNYPGVVALFATGCAGDVNTGHCSTSSLSTERKPDRSFSMAKTIGLDIARAVVGTELCTLSGGYGTAEICQQLNFKQRETAPPEELAKQWRAKAAASTNDADSVAQIWANWAENSMGKSIDPLNTRCTAFNWCGAHIVAMPGEIFAQTALEIRQSIATDTPLFYTRLCR